jgi:hypothetical protein
LEILFEQGIWGVRTDQNLREVYKPPDPVADINRRLERLRHMIRTDQTRVSRDIFKVSQKTEEKKKGPD